jgi:two-component system, NarL family, invasion response regulator UvrY
MIRVAILEEQTLVRELIANLLEEEGTMQVVAQGAVTDHLVELVREHRVDVVLIGTVAGGGIEAPRALAAADLKAHVLVVATGRTVSPSRLLAAGVSGYVSGQQSRRELLDAIVRIHGGERVMPTHHSEPDPVAILSPRELETLRYLAQGMTNREIAERLGISTKTIDTHRGHVLKKLNLRNNSDVTRFALEHGLTDLDAAGRLPSRGDADFTAAPAGGGPGQARPHH